MQPAELRQWEFGARALQRQGGKFFHMALGKKAVAQAAESATYFFGLTGVATLGQVVHEWTLQPVLFWIIAPLGAIMLRRAIQGPDAERLTLFGVLLGVFLAWLGVDPVIDLAGLDPEIHKPWVTAFLAGGGEHAVRFMLSAKVLKAVATRFVGGKPE